MILKVERSITETRPTVTITKIDTTMIKKTPFRTDKITETIIKMLGNSIKKIDKNLTALIQSTIMNIRKSDFEISIIRDSSSVKIGIILIELLNPKDPKMRHK